MEGRTGGIITICHPSGRAVVSSTASTAMAAPLFGPIMIFKITHFEFSFPLFFIFSVFFSCYQTEIKKIKTTVLSFAHRGNAPLRFEGI